MVDVSDAVVASLVVPIAAAIPLVLERIPGPPAVELGRPADSGLRSAEPGTRAARTRVGTTTHAVAIRAMSVRAGSPGADGRSDSSALSALGSVGPLVAERLLGALELVVPKLEFAGAPDLAAYLGPPPSGRFAFASSGQDSQAMTAARMLEYMLPGTAELVEAVIRRLPAHPTIMQLLAPPPTADDEASIAAAHGAAYLALGVATASAVLAGRLPGGAIDGAAAVVGIGIGAAVVLLREVPMPPGYADALLAKTREEYLLPRRAGGSVSVSGHRFALVEGEIPHAVDFSGNGLVAVVDGGAVIRTGVAEGSVQVLLTVLGEAPPAVESGWDEVVEISWRAAEGRASVVGPTGPGDRQLRWATPPWPGDYRLRVHARGRDDEDRDESYELVVWQAPAGPEVVHKCTDRLGHRLRGEPEPATAEQPEKAYRWLRRSPLAEAATVTVVTGASVEDVLRAFGADAAQPMSMQQISEEVMQAMSVDPWVAVLAADDAVLAVEYNGYQGSTESVLRRASAGGRAASMFWNVDAMTRLSFAEGGQVLAGFEPPQVPGDAVGPAVAAALAGLDFDDYRDMNGKGLVAVGRFTGRGITEQDLASIETAGIAFRIVPDLPELYPYHEPPETMRRMPGQTPLLGTDAWLRLPEPRLRDFAWWCAAEAARYAGLADDPDIAASIAARRLTPQAHARARKAQLHGAEHPWMWLALHRATNPDPRAAATEAIDAARYTAGPHATELMIHARNHLS